MTQMYLSKLQNLQHFVNKAYILLYFFVVPVAFNNLVSMGYLALSLFLVVLQVIIGARVNKADVFKALLLVLSLFVIIAFSTYSKTNSILVFVYAIICYFSYKSFENPANRKAFNFDWFYWLSLLAICIKLVLQIIDKGLFFDSFELGTGAWDKNYSAVALFCFFVYCDQTHRRSILWKIVGLVVLFYLRSSRGSLLLGFLFIGFKILSYYLKRKGVVGFDLKSDKSFSQKRVLLCLAFSLVFVIGFSYFWTYYVSASGVTAYHESLNDGSNATRFRANVYAVQQLLSNHRFLFYGYDNDIRFILGDIDALDFTRFEGYRLVQSHNSFLNMAIKNGLLFTIFYFVFLFASFKKVFKISNCPYLISLFVISMFMHGIFVTDYLLFFLVSIYSGCNHTLRNSTYHRFR